MVTYPPTPYLDDKDGLDPAGSPRGRPPLEPKAEPDDNDDDDDWDDDEADFGHDRRDAVLGGLLGKGRSTQRRPIRPPWLQRAVSLLAAHWRTLSHSRYLYLLVALSFLFLLALGRSIGAQRAGPPVREGRYSALYEACRTNPWRPGLYVNCSLSMGLNNLRSEFSTCLKYAFDAGAGLVLPGIALRDNETLNAMQWEGIKFQYGRTDLYFDVEGLKSDLAYWCPAMELRNQFDTTDIAVQVKDKPRVWWELRFSAGEYRAHFDELLRLNGVKSWGRRRGAIVEETHQPYSTWNYRSQPADVTHAWFDLIQWAPRLRRIANQVAAHELLQQGYVGMHLRLEKDVFDYWHGFEAQTNAYAFYIDKRQEKTIYLACGDRKWKPKVEERFPHHRVVDKWDLAPAGTELRKEIEGLTFDEMAVIDYIPMLNSGLVMGIGVSSFAYLLGVDRRENKTGHYADSLHQELMPEGDPMVGDKNTLLLPFILPEDYTHFP